MPQDFIELQPANVYGWQSQWRGTVSSKVAYVLSVLESDVTAWRASRERALRRRSAVAAAVARVEEESRAQAAPLAGAAAFAPPAGAAAFAPPAAPAVPVISPQQLARKRAEAAFRALVAAEAEDALARCDVSSAPPPKFIMFSRYFDHLQLVATHLASAGVRFVWLVYSKLDNESRRRNIVAFKTDPSCNVLLMDDAGMHGHDLSVASHVILLEPLRDASAEAQVVSRAHRMGCTAKEVRVQTLAMLGTAEEGLLRLGHPSSAEDGRIEENDDDSGDSQARKVLKALLRAPPAQQHMGGEPQKDELLPDDDVQQWIEHFFTFPDEPAKLMRATAASVGALGGSVVGAACRRRSGDARLAPVSPAMPPPPRAAH